MSEKEERDWPRPFPAPGQPTSPGGDAGKPTSSGGAAGEPTR